MDRYLSLSALKYPLGALLAFVALFLLFRAWHRYFRRGSLEKRRSEWAKSLQFSFAQQRAMRALWSWYMQSRRPAGGALSGMDPGELSDLINKTGFEIVPKSLRLPDEEQRRNLLITQLERRGMNSVEAQITSGMRFGGIGPAQGVRDPS